MSDKPGAGGPRHPDRITELAEFASENEEREWWAEHHREVAWDLLPTETFEFDVPPTEKRSRSVRLRMEPALVERYRVEAARLGMGYQTLMREVLSRRRPG